MTKLQVFEVTRSAARPGVSARNLFVFSVRSRPHFATSPRAPRQPAGVGVSTIRRRRRGGAGWGYVPRGGGAPRQPAGVQHHPSWEVKLSIPHPGSPLGDVQINPFEVLAAGNNDGGTTFADHPHTWHLDTTDVLALAGPGIFASTQRLSVSTGDALPCAEGFRWWADPTACRRT